MLDAPVLSTSVATTVGSEHVAELRRTVQRAMTTHAGVLRTAGSIASARAVLDSVWSELPPVPLDPELSELSNLVQVGAALLQAAAAREESRGAHTRSDFPGAHEAQRCRLVIGS